MKKSILNLGKFLNKEELMAIKGQEGKKCVAWCSDGSCNCWSNFNFFPYETEPCSL